MDMFFFMKQLFFRVRLAFNMVLYKIYYLLCIYIAVFVSSIVAGGR